MYEYAVVPVCNQLSVRTDAIIKSASWLAISCCAARTPQYSLTLFLPNKFVLLRTVRIPPIGVTPLSAKAVMYAS